MRLPALLIALSAFPVHPQSSRGTTPDYQRLHASEATASSFLKSNWNKYEENYHPNYALDDDPRTAWVEGADGDGLGESITVPVSPLKSARALRLVIVNGYQKSKALLEANAAPMEVTVRVTGPSGKQSAEKKVTLERKMGPQQLELPLSAGIAEVTLKIDSVHPGRKYKDTVISDLQVLVDSDVPYLKGVEEGKKRALLGWKKERLAAAKYFASLPKEYIYAAGKFTSSPGALKLIARRWERVIEQKDDVPKGVEAEGYQSLDDQFAAGTVPGGYSEEDQKLILELDGLKRIYATRKDARFVSMESKPKTRHLPPDGVPVPSALAAIVNLGEQTLFEAKGLGSLKPVMKAGHPGEDYSHSEVLSNFLLLEGTAMDPKKVFFVFTEVTSDRTTTTETTWYLAELRGGKLQRLASRQQSDSDFENNLRVRMTRLKWTPDKIVGFETRTVSETESTVDGPDVKNDGTWVETAQGEAVPTT